MMERKNKDQYHHRYHCQHHYNSSSKHNCLTMYHLLVIVLRVTLYVHTWLKHSKVAYLGGHPRKSKNLSSTSYKYHPIENWWTNLIFKYKCTQIKQYWFGISANISINYGSLIYHESSDYLCNTRRVILVQVLLIFWINE